MKTPFFIAIPALVGLAVALTGCKKEETEKLLPPTVTITKSAETQTNVKFDISATDADECAYIFGTFTDIGENIPEAATILAKGTKIDPAITSTIVKETAPSTEYIVYAAAKNATGFSEVAKCEFNVPNLVTVEVSNITKSSYTFTITTDGNRGYKYTAMPLQYLEDVYEVQEAVTEDEKQRAAMRYLAWYGTKDSGTKEFTHKDNETYIDGEGEESREYVRELIAGMEYVVLAVGYGEDEKFAGKVAINSFTLAESGTPTGKVQFEVVGNPGVISAKTRCTPDENVLYYKYILVKKTSRDDYIAKNGQTQYRYMVANSDQSEHLIGPDEQTWKNLSPDTEYIQSFVIVDKEHNVDWKEYELKTAKADEQSADIQLTGTVGDPNGYGTNWNSMSFNVKSENIILPSKYFFGYTSAITRLMNSGLNLEQIVDEYGEAFSQYQINNINSENGLTANFLETLKPDVEYTYIVALTNANNKKEIKSMVLSTEKRTVEKLSSSSLFEDLKGEWTAVVPIKEYDSASGSYKDYEYKFDVTVGNDGEFADLCRSYNWLMCKGWFGIEYKGPDDLRNDPEYDGYYKDIPENIFYDFGPKWFFEIDPDGNVTVPTNSSFVPPLVNYTEGQPAARLAAVSSYVGSESLPVEVAPDKNTITIKPYTEGYMPAYLMMISEGSYMPPAAKTSGDIVLTRK